MKTTTLKIAIHRDESNPVFGENTIQLEICDEAAGPFFKITTVENGNHIFLELDQIEVIVSKARTLAEIYKMNTGEK